MPKQAFKKIAITIDPALLKRVERERTETGETRSEFIRRAVEGFLQAEQVAQWDREYVEAYRRMPETPEELAEARAVVAASIASTEWDDGWDAEYEETHRRETAAR